MKTKPNYAPVPIRAIQDVRLTRADLAVLSAIAAHDRLGANKIGCYAGRDRLAALANVNISTFSKSVTRLGQLSYVEKTNHPLNKRLTVYRVIYTSEDYFWSLSEDARKAKIPEVDARTGRPEEGYKFEIIETSHSNIFSETGNTFSETDNRSHRICVSDDTFSGSQEPGHCRWITDILKSDENGEEPIIPEHRELRSLLSEVERKCQRGSFKRSAVNTVLRVLEPMTCGREDELYLQRVWDEYGDCPGWLS